MAQKNTVPEATHPLMEGEITYIKDWKKWKESWQSTTLAEFRHSLLHFGFAVSASWEEAIDRICLYLDLADRYASSGAFYREDQYVHFDRLTSSGVTVFGPEVTNFCDLRRTLSQKAFQEICQNFFKNTAEKDRGYIPSWARLSAEPKVLEKLFWFFRLDGYGVIENLPYYSEDSDHHIALAKEFVYSLCVFPWECENPQWFRGQVSDAMLKTLYEAKPNMITLLFGLRRLDDLLKERKKRYGIDERCLRRLEELALGFELSLPSAPFWDNEQRKPTTLQEACLGNSQAAQILLLLRTKRAEEKRLSNIRELESQRREAEREIKKLQS